MTTGGVIALSLGLPAALLLVIATALLQRARRPFVRVPAEVIGFAEGRMQGRTMFAPIYRATLSDGRTLESQRGVSRSSKTPPVGTRVTLRYRAGDASPLSSDGFLPYLAPAILFGVGVPLGVAALLVALVAR